MTRNSALQIDKLLHYFRLILIIIGGLLIVAEQMPVMGGWVVFAIFAASMIATGFLRHTFNIREHIDG